MPRAKRGNKRLEKRKKILALAKGYRGTKSKLYRSAKESVERGLNFAYTGRKLKKRDFRKLWIVRINAACRLNDIKYSQFIQRFKKLWKSNNTMMVQQLICDQCKIVLLEKDSKHLNEERFPITEEEAKMIDRDHRGHECHIELVEKFA